MIFFQFLQEFRDKYDILQKEYRKIKKQLQGYLEECNEKSTEKIVQNCVIWKKSPDLFVSFIFTDANNTIIENNNTVNTSVIANIVNSELPSVRKKEKNYMGMFEFSPDDISTILKILINGNPARSYYLNLDSKNLT